MATDDTVAFNMRMDRELKERLDEYCELSGRSRTYVVTVCLRRFLDARDARELRTRSMRSANAIDSQYGVREERTIRDTQELSV